MNQINENILREAEKEGIKRFVVAGIIKREEEILLLKRKSGDFMGGIHELPSGKVENEESLEEALEREIREETGLEIKKIGDYIGSFDYNSGSGEKTRQFNFLIEVERRKVKINPEEHESFVWVKPKENRLYNITENIREIIEKIPETQL